MSKVVIRRTEALSGEVAAPSSKSYTHRMLIAALLSGGTSRIKNYLVSDDTLATLRVIKAFGAKGKRNKNILEVTGVKQQLKAPKEPVNCGESGATLRFMIPVAALAPGDTTFVMGHSLSKRPLIPLLQSLAGLGVKAQYQTGELYVKIQGGGINGGETTLKGDISSQFISGLLFACPMARKNTKIVLTTPMESKGYVQMTEEILNRHGVKVFISEDFRRISVPHGQSYSPCNHVVPGDFSSAAYLLAAAAITSSKIKVKNLNCNTKQGDKAIMDILKQAGLEVKVGEGFVEVEGTLSNPISLDARDVPDLVPACVAIACYTKGISKIYNAGRLRYKESNRLMAIYSEMKKMGADLTVDENSLTIRGPCEMHGAIINPHNDHRIAMACTVAALSARGDTKILKADCVRKSYPSFFRDLKLLGADILVGEFDR